MGSRVKEGGGRGESVEDEGQSSGPKEATANKNVKVVHTLIMSDRRRDLRSIASKVEISFMGSIQTYILGMSKVSARWVP